MSGQSSNSMPIQCADLDVLNDNILENDETFSVRLSSWSNRVYITTGRQAAEVTIREDDTDCKCDHSNQRRMVIINFLQSGR